MEETIIFIPARKGSKGFPFKNRLLFDKTASIIPSKYQKNVFISTDDEIIIKKAKQYNFNVIIRPENLCNDTASVKDALLHLIEEKNIKNKNIIMLYLTYPQRVWRDVETIYEYYKLNKGNSLACCEAVKEHPYLMFYKNKNFGIPLVKHSMYRRQDYPICFKLSLYVGIYNCKEVKNLSDLLVNDETLFYNLEEEKVDVDYEKDFLNIKETNDC